MKRENPFIAQPAEFGRHGTAVNRKIVCELLPVEWDRKVCGLCESGFIREIREQFITRGTLGNMLYFFAQKIVPGCHRLQKILDQTVVKGTGGRADRQDLAKL